VFPNFITDKDIFQDQFSLRNTWYLLIYLSRYLDQETAKWYISIRVKLHLS